MAKTIVILFLILAAVSGFAQTNGTISCASGPLRTTETYAPYEDTDNGMGRLQLTANCTMKPNAGATGYLSAGYTSGVVTINHPVDISFTDGVVVVNNGSTAGWTFDLEVTLPSGIQKHYKMSVMSGVAPPNNRHDQSWPIIISLPVGSTFKADVYGFADNVSACSSTCYGSGQWNLQ